MEQLTMSRSCELPGANIMQLPEGYIIRKYIKNNSDETGWCECFNGDIGVNEVSAEMFKNKMLMDNTVDPENIYFLISPDGKIAGTVTYQYTDDEDTGCIHMVGIKSEYQGNNLAVPLNAYAVYKMIEDGKKKIILTTDDFRIPAIRTYLRIGFVPVINPGDTNMKKRWEDIMTLIDKKKNQKDNKTCR